MNPRHPRKKAVASAPIPAKLTPMARFARMLAPVLFLAWAVGCVERTVTIATEPAGAKIFLNDDEIGDTPVKVPFTWYGDYDIVVRKPGYKTIRTHHKLNAPWYQFPVIDLFAECLVPYTIHDDRVLPTYALEMQAAPEQDELILNSENLREQARTGQ